MLKSLRSRNIALLISVLMASQLLSLALVWVLAIRPQAERVAGILARNVSAISMTLETIPEAKRRALIERINKDGAIRIVDGQQSPPEDRGAPTLVERLFMRAFVKEMASNGSVLWKGGRNGQMWVRINVGESAYWISNERPKGWSPTGAMLASFMLTLVLAASVGIVLQRRLARPLQAFADAADNLGAFEHPAPLSTNGPKEIASVAHAFNDMVTRLAQQEKDRTFMLAGISHDLRTPLAKLRLAIALNHNNDTQTEAIINRQFDHIDLMLSQFLDFARGLENEKPQKFDVRTLLEDAIDMARSEGVQLECNKIELVGHRLALTRAIINLLRNAALYGQAPVAVSATQTKTEIQISVRDSGSGISDELITTIDRPFVRGEAARPSNGGTGLGLAIVQHVAKAHGGRLELNNIAAGGFQAQIILPRTRNS
jgi:two-component system, OmpR family, osmolarity sensor histidine kinase EnvZ